MFERLLLAIDDSPASEVAISFATALAQRGDSAVHILHVNEYIVGGRNVTLKTRSEATELIGGAVLSLRAAGVRASATALVASHRDVPATIVEVAQARGSQAIVLGSRRQRRLGRIFSPQVRERTTRLTALPILTAPSPLLVSAHQLLNVDDVVRAELERAAATSR
ncbi:MAG TPA: universal stress protein [Acidimicrobiales bacterium]|jgi:nucleotide-binding universal stress UspA family protein